MTNGVIFKRKLLPIENKSKMHAESNSDLPTVLHILKFTLSQFASLNAF